MTTNPREEKGKEIALRKQDVTRINPDYYIVKSQTTLRQYNIIKADEKWISLAVGFFMIGYGIKKLW